MRSESESRPKSRVTIILAFLFTLTILVLGYVLLGILPAILFSFGFVGGFVLWLSVPTAAPFRSIRIPFYITLGLFILHKLEERYLDFFPALTKITGVPLPDTTSIFVFLLYALAGMWLFIPFLVRSRNEFGYYLAWTFFTSMGVTELAHFAFPFLAGGGYGYFPGMASAAILAPAGWWGMFRLWKGEAKTQAGEDR